MGQPPPLTGIRVLEFAGLAPGPFAGLQLADAGAMVLRIDRAIPGLTHTTSNTIPPTDDPLARHKSSIALDLKSVYGVGFIKSIIPHVDVVIDPFRPGILEKLGLAPTVLQALNPRIIVARITGFRRDGRYQSMAGHDINYLAISGVLALLGPKDYKPFPPANILGDFAAGGAMLFQGILLALLAREKSGMGQVVEVNMVDASSYLATFPRMLLGTSLWNRPRGENMLDGGCPWYSTYMTKDSKFMSVGALELRFFRELIRGLGLAGKGLEHSREDRESWPHLRSQFTALFQERTQAEWEAIFDGTDACCTPVLDYHTLRTDPSREGDQRPAIALQDTPALPVSTTFSLYSTNERGAGDGYHPTALYPGQGGEATILHWLGWKRGRDYEVENGGLVKKPQAIL